MRWRPLALAALWQCCGSIPDASLNSALSHRIRIDFYPAHCCCCFYICALHCYKTVLAADWSTHAKIHNIAWKKSPSAQHTQRPTTNQSVQVTTTSNKICWVKGIVHPWMKIRILKFTHPLAIQDVDEFVSSTDLEKFSIPSLAQQWILCSEWVPSEWESKQLIKTSTSNQHHSSPSINVLWSQKLCVHKKQIHHYVHSP